jgi:apolipoprotein N-acyltransferase
MFACNARVRWLRVCTAYLRAWVACGFPWSHAYVPTFVHSAACVRARAYVGGAAFVHACVHAFLGHYVRSCMSSTTCCVPACVHASVSGNDCA